MYLLDTNVVSELRRGKPHGGVVAWLAGIPDEAIFLSAVTLGEMQSGVEITRRQDPAKAEAIEGWLDQVAASFNILPMDGETFRHWARLLHGRSDTLIEDAMIAATAVQHGLTVVTRNVRDFRRFGVAVFDPFATRR